MIRFLLYAGVSASDDLSMANIAASITEKGFQLPASLATLRVGLTVPLAAVFATFGVGEWQLATLPLFYSLLGIVLAFAICRRLVGPQAGLLSAAILAVFPLDVEMGTRFFPDLPLGVVLAASFLLALLGRDSKHPMLWYFAAGMVWGYAYLIKVEAVFMGATFLALATVDRNHLRGVIVIIAVFFLVIFAENAFYFISSDKLLYRLKIINSIEIVVSEDYSGKQLWIFPKAWFLTVYNFGSHYYLLFFALFWTIMTRQKSLSVIVVWIVVYLLWLQFGGNPFKQTYSIKSHLLRYCSMVSVPMAVLIGAFLAHLGAKGWRRTSFCLMGATVATALFFVNLNTLNSERERATTAALHYALRHDLFPLYLDQASFHIVRFKLGGRSQSDRIFQVQSHNFKTGKTELIDLSNKEGYLLINRDSMKYGARRYYMKEINLETLGDKLEIVHVVDNPAPSLAYSQMRLLVFLASFIPNRFLREKITGTGNEILEDGDVVIFSLIPN